MAKKKTGLAKGAAVAIRAKDKHQEYNWGAAPVEGGKRTYWSDGRPGSVRNKDSEPPKYGPTEQANTIKKNSEFVTSRTDKMDMGRAAAQYKKEVMRDDVKKRRGAVKGILADYRKREKK